MRQGDHRLDDREAVLVLGHADYETAIDLEIVDRQSGNVGERGIPGTEIVHCDFHAESAHGLQYGDDGFDIFHDHALGDLKAEQGASLRGLSRRLDHGGDEIFLPKLKRRDVHRDSWWFESARCPKLIKVALSWRLMI